MHPIDRKPKVLTSEADNHLSSPKRNTGQVVKLPSKTNPSQKKPVVFSGSGSNLVLGKPKGWLPFGITRIIRSNRKVDNTEPKPDDLAIIEDMKTDELLMRLARVIMSVQNSELGKTEIGVKGLKRLEIHIRGIYQLAAKTQLKRQ